MSSSLNRGVEKVEVTLKWDPSPLGRPAHDLDLVAATYTSGAPANRPAYLVHFDSRSPDGTIILERESRTGQGFGSDEVMRLELDRLAPDYARVVVGVVIQQREGRRTFGDISGPTIRLMEGLTELTSNDFAEVPSALSATIAEFSRNGSGTWDFRPALRGFDADPQEFTERMGEV
ncbi:TerD family protein [Streptomyces sp. NBC_01498]|uniref:TerD family protein n=1 Tax=Streptomyces sp. NBC_01498 TaxID=2975870 RepID=UPI002E7BBD86|nr:TerD family protein [Streptomyces sp. NBC_01498]WTL24276.1 TerD family protein [Streptomyces sp. NBC_01498]